MSKVLQEEGFGSLPSLTETNPRDHVKSITTTEEAKTLKKDDKMPLIELILKELKKLQVNSAKSAISLRRLPKEKSRIEEEIEATMSVHCATILKDALPLKEKDLGKDRPADYPMDGGDDGDDDDGDSSGDDTKMRKMRMRIMRTRRRRRRSTSSSGSTHY
ncbi:hypothetical protein Tco_0678998 [Tanacetum coccineum]|uniref:Uncharacterized protein n=1 Tax=Tanacetum coccineum TaxID=301880 RepID=A0ABQ4XGL9_9ASTR